MSGPDEGAIETERRREAARWLAVAMEDARVALACLEMARPAFGIAAYHCQQAAEKLVKGLAGRAIPFYPALTSSLESIGPLTLLERCISLSWHRGRR